MITINAVEQIVSLRTKNGGNIIFFIIVSEYWLPKNFRASRFVNDNFSFSRDGVEITLSLG